MAPFLMARYFAGFRMDIISGFINFKKMGKTMYVYLDLKKSESKIVSYSMQL